MKKHIWICIPAGEVRKSYPLIKELKLDMFWEVLSKSENIQEYVGNGVFTILKL